METENTLFRYIPEPALVKDAIANRKLTKVPVLHVGEFEHADYGKFTITEDILHGMVDSFEHNGGANNPLECDYEHDIDSTARPPESLKSAEIYALSVEDMKFDRYEGPTLVALTLFTDEGRRLVASGEVNRVSAEILLEHKFEGVGEPVPFLNRFTLTNRPFMKTLPAIKLSDKRKSTPIIYTGEITMKKRANKKASKIKLASKADMLDKILKASGLPDDADIEDLLAFVQALVAKNTDTAQEPDTMPEPATSVPLETELTDDNAIASTSLKDGDVTSLKLSLTESKAKNRELEIRLKALEDENDKRDEQLHNKDLEYLLMTAVSDGQITKELAGHYRKTFARERGNPLSDLAFQLSMEMPKFGTNIPPELVGNDTEAEVTDVIQLTDTAAKMVKKGEYKTHLEALTAQFEGV